jgi:hypothetical protein
MLVQSTKGDLDDPIRRTKEYLDDLYIEVPAPETIEGAAFMMGKTGGLAKSLRKTEAARANGLKGGRPRRKPPEEDVP